MAIKEVPITYRVYYKSMKDTYTQLRENAIAAKKDLTDLINESYNTICKNIETFEKEFNVNLNKYEEFRNNTYIDGKFLKVAKGLFINRNNNYTLVSDLFDLYNFARKQKELYNLNKDIELYDKILALNIKQYNEILKKFYYAVHKEMIIKGVGYVFEHPIGWTCINRCHITRQSCHIDYAATKKRKAQLIAEGKRLYNKEEAKWCKQNGIEYHAEDGRVYMNNEYCYEIPLCNCKLPNGTKYKLEVADYRGREVRGVTNEELAKKANNNLEEICKLSVDIRTKLNICNSVDKTLYLNFIRNENQEPLNITKVGRKNRQ